MALDARRRQKKAEKRKAKERAKHKELARRKTEDIGQRLANVASAPILHCFTTQDLWERGMAQVVVSRELANGFVAFSSFLVDRFCLGVKDAFCGFMAKSEYMERLYDETARRFELVKLTPSAARHLVERSIEYAKSYGLSPHPNYARARHIFGTIDPSASDREFEFGKDGKPLFVPGPHDSPARCASIVGILEQHLGKTGFNYIIAVPASALAGIEDQADWSDESDLYDDQENDIAEDDTDRGDDRTIEGSVASPSSPQLPIPLAASLRRMIFGHE